MGKYITASDVTAEGATASTSRIDLRIAKWEAIVEELTRNVFVAFEPGELTFDGNNSDMLHFSIPLISVTSLKVNNDDTALDASEYRAYTGRTRPQDDRQNPKIELTGNRSNSLYAKSHGIFYKGADQKITAKWGFVDDDLANPGSYVTPPAVKASIVQLVVHDLDGYFDSSAGGSALSSVRREKTDGHEIEYQDVEALEVTWAMIPRSVSDVLAMYRCPWKISSPGSGYFTRSVSGY